MMDVRSAGRDDRFVSFVAPDHNWMPVFACLTLILLAAVALCWAALAGILPAMATPDLYLDWGLIGP
jgi:hypothetical protein